MGCRLVEAVILTPIPFRHRIPVFVLDVSGGGIFNAGKVNYLTESTFLGNTGASGPAILNIDGGAIGSLRSTMFEANTLFCSEGFYGYDEVRLSVTQRGLVDYVKY